MPKLNKSKTLGVTLFFACIFSYTWINSFYISSRNVDYTKYYGYINYFTGIDVDIDYGQGVIYYFLIAKRVLSKVDIVNLSNLEFVLNSAVHEVNFILFLIGLLGFFLFLNFKKYKTETILASLIILVFFPQTIYLRAVMKPEILAFAFTPWVLLNLERYLLDRNLKNLLYAIPFLSLIINSKGSIAGMILVYLIISYFEILKKINLKNFIIVLISMLSILSLVQFENYSITGNTIFDRLYDPEYDFKAKPEILLNVNVFEAVKYPFFKLNDYGDTYHSKSVINPILLDTFGDYFNQLFDSDSQYFLKVRKNVFVNNSEYSFSETRQLNYQGIFSEYLIFHMHHIRKIVSFIFSMIFYIAIIALAVKDKKNRKYYIAPLLGILVLYLNSLGIPSNNYNPIKGDTFKAFYFSFLLSIPILFLGVKIFKEINSKKMFILILYLLSIFFIAGHPKENNQLLSEHLIVSNQYSPFCAINNFLIYENALLKSVFKSGNINNLKSDCSEKKLGISENRENYDKKYATECIGSKQEVLVNHGTHRSLIPNSSECRIYVLEQVKNKNNLIIPKIPFISITVMMCCFLFIFLETRLFFHNKQ